MANKPGLYSNIANKRARIKAGSGEKMRKVGSKGAPTAMQFKQAATICDHINKKTYSKEEITLLKSILSKHGCI